MMGDKQLTGISPCSQESLHWFTRLIVPTDNGTPVLTELHGKIDVSFSFLEKDDLQTQNNFS